MNNLFRRQSSERGFSLFELIIAMTVTIVIMALVGTLLAQSLRMRTRANEKTDALADVQRALNIMSREIAVAGLGLGTTDNGIVAADSITDSNGNSTIRIRSNLNKFNPNGTASVAAQNGIGVPGEDAGEDIKYFIYPAANTNLLARYDALSLGGGSATVLANRLDTLRIHYYARRVTYQTADCDITAASLPEVDPSAAKYLVIAVCVRQTAVGVPGSPGFQPEGRVLLVSDVTLRNANLLDY
jgi:Tfp pilus assembly protein PilW